MPKLETRHQDQPGGTIRVNTAHKALPKLLRKAVIASEYVVKRLNKLNEEDETVTQTRQATNGVAVLSETHVSIVPIRLSNPNDVQHYPIDAIEGINIEAGNDGFLQPPWNEKAEKITITFNEQLLKNWILSSPTVRTGINKVREPKLLAGGKVDATPVTLYTYDNDENFPFLLNRVWRAHHTANLLNLEIHRGGDEPLEAIRNCYDAASNQLRQAQDIMSQGEAMAELADLCMRYKTAKRLALEENLVYMLFEDLDVSLKEYHQYVPPFTTSDERTRQQQLSTHRLRSERSRNILKHLGCILQLLNCIIFNSENVPMSLRDEFLTTHLSGGLCKLFGYLLHDFCPSYWRQRGPPQAYSHEQVSESKLWIKKCLRGKQSAPKAPKVLSRGKFLSEPFTPTDMRISPFSFASSYLFHEEDSSCFSSSASTIKSGETFSIDEGSSDTDSMSGEKIVQDTYCSQQESTLGETTLLLKSNTEVSINFVRGKVGRRHGILLSELPKEGRFEGVETLYKSNAMARGGGNHQNYTEHKKQAGLEDRAINLRAPVYQFSSEQAADVGDISLRDDSTKYEYHKRVEEEKQSYNDCYSYDPLNPPNVRRKGCASNTFRRLIRILKQGHPSRFRDATKPLLYLYRSEEKLNYLKGLSKAEITQKKPAYEFLKIEGHRDDFLRNYCFSDKSKFSRTRMIEKPHQPLKLGLVRSENQFRDDLENFLREEGIRTSKKDRDRLLAIGKRLGVVDTVDDIKNDNSMKTLHHVPYTSDQVTVAMREREGDSITSGVSELKHMADAEDENDRIQRLYENDDLRHLENNGEQQLSEHKPKDVNDRVEWGLIKSLRYSAFTLLLSYLYLLDDVKVYGGTAKLNFASLICDVPESILRSSFHYLIVNVSECLRASTLQMCSYIMDKTDNSSDKKLLNNAESEAEDIDSEEEDSSDCPFRIITGKERIHGSCLVHRLAVVAKLALIIVECNPDLRILENDLTSLVRDLHDHDEVMDLLDDIQKNVHSILLEALEDVSELVKIMKQNLSH